MLCRVLAVAPHGYAVVGLDGTCLAATPILAKIAGEPSPDALEGRLPLESGRDAFAAALRAVERGETTRLQVDYVPFSRAARGRCRMTLMPLPFPGDAAVGGALVEVRETESDGEWQFRSLVAQAPHAICLVRDGRVLYANPVAVRALGGSVAADVVGRRVHEFFAVAPGHGELPLGAADVRGKDGLLFAPGRPGVPVELDLWTSVLDDGEVTVVLMRERGSVTELAQPSAPESGQASPMVRTRGVPLRGRNGRAPIVLVCDDETRLATLTAGLLDQYGYGSLTVSSAMAALEALGRATPPCDVILLDLTLPDGNAGEVVQKMRAAGYDQPVILTSGYAEEDIAPELLSDPLIAGYLAKPYSVERLVEAIGRALEQRR
jgi:CheY-like chemotaxis protein